MADNSATPSGKQSKAKAQPVVSPPVAAAETVAASASLSTKVTPVTQAKDTPVITAAPVKAVPPAVAPVAPVAPVSPVIPVQPLPIVKSITLTPGQPYTTSSPTLAVTGFTQAGTYTFSLVVQDDLGVASKPSTVQVAVTSQPVIK